MQIPQSATLTAPLKMEPLRYCASLVKGGGPRSGGGICTPHLIASLDKGGGTPLGVTEGFT